MAEDIIEQIKALEEQAKAAERDAAKHEAAAEQAKMRLTELEAQLSTYGVENWAGIPARLEELKAEAEQAYAEATKILNGEA